jgi:hypothetical protein
MLSGISDFRFVIAWLESLWSLIKGVGSIPLQVSRQQLLVD